MLPSSKRLSTSLFKKVMDEGVVFHSPLFLLRLIKITGKSRFSVTVPKKVAKTAVERNKTRRCVYSSLSKHFDTILPGFYGVFIAKNTILTANLVKIDSDIKEVLGKSRILK